MARTLEHGPLPLLSELMHREEITMQWIAEVSDVSSYAVRSLLLAEEHKSPHKSTRPETVEIIAKLFGLPVDGIQWCLPIKLIGKASGTPDSAHNGAGHQGPVCSKCSVVLPLTGKCDDCG